MKKIFWKSLILCSTLLLASAECSITHVSASENKKAYIQQKDTIFTPITVESTTPFWDQNYFAEFSGNNLNELGFVTPDTLQLKVEHHGSLVGYLGIQKDNKIIAKEPYVSNTDTIINMTGEIFQKGEKYTLCYIYTLDDITPLATFYCSPSLPVITATDRTVEKDNPNFDIMDGVSATDFQGKDITPNIQVEDNVDIHTPGVYPVTYSVTDQYGQFTSLTIYITVKDTSPALTPPTLEEVTSTDTTITGTGTPGSQVYVVLGTDFDTYRTTVKEDGTFVLALEHPYLAGTSITAYAQDEQGNKSESVYYVVKEGEITVGVDQILSSSTTISGYSAPGATIEVAINNTRDRLFYGTADSTGKYTIDLHGASYPAGTKVVVTATLNKKSGSKSVIVYPQKVTINTISAGDSTIYGKADPNATIHLSVHSKDYTFNADAAGNFYGSIDSPLVSGDRITTYQTSNGIESESITVLIN